MPLQSLLRFKHHFSIAFDLKRETQK
ncbi:MAG: hypothetical protein ACI9OS_002106, partial [Ulvibacter sp.]